MEQRTLERITAEAIQNCSTEERRHLIRWLPCDEHMSQMLGLTAQERIAGRSHAEKMIVSHQVQLEDLRTVAFMEIVYK